MKPTLNQLFLILWLNAFGVRSEVNSDFGNCLQYFYKSIPPRLAGNVAEPPRSICQRYNNVYHYATLYSTGLRIPVYSAYTLPGRYSGTPEPQRRSTWFVEPQVGNSFNLVNYESKQVADWKLNLNISLKNQRD